MTDSTFEKPTRIYLILQDMHDLKWSDHAIALEIGWHAPAIWRLRNRPDISLDFRKAEKIIKLAKSLGLNIYDDE